MKAILGATKSYSRIEAHSLVGGKRGIVRKNSKGARENQMAQAYCFRCKTKREIKNAEPVNEVLNEEEPKENFTGTLQL